MKTLQYSKPNNLSLLHDELLTAIPTLAPIRDAEGIGTPVMRVEGRDNDIWLIVPDDVDEVVVAAVIAAHDESAITNAEVTRARKEVLETKLTDDSITFEEMKELMRLRG